MASDFDHVTTIEETDDEYFDADCTCGWADEGFEEREDAEAVAEEHKREVGA